MCFSDERDDLQSYVNETAAYDDGMEYHQEQEPYKYYLHPAGAAAPKDFLTETYR
jgi:hypothetical protein